MMGPCWSLNPKDKKDKEEVVIEVEVDVANRAVDPPKNLSPEE